MSLVAVLTSVPTGCRDSASAGSHLQCDGVGGHPSHNLPDDVKVGRYGTVLVSNGGSIMASRSSVVAFWPSMASMGPSRWQRRVGAQLLANEAPRGSSVQLGRLLEVEDSHRLPGSARSATNVNISCCLRCT